MNAKTSLVLAIVFLLLGSFTVFDPFKIKEKRQQKQDLDASVFWFKEKKINRLAINRDGKNLVFECVKPEGCSADAQEGWKITEPFQELADSSNVSTLFGSLGHLTPLDTLNFEKETLNLADFGLDAPSVELRFQLKDSSTEDWIRLGSKAAVGTSLYAQASNHPNEVLIVGMHLSTELSKEIFHWRNKRIFPSLRTEDIKGIHWQAAENFQLQQKDGTWTLQKPIAARANSAILNGLAGTLAYVSATNIPADDKNSKEAKKLLGSKPSLRVEIVAEDKTQSLEFYERGEKSQSKVYVTSAAQNWVAQIDAGLLERFRKSLKEYRDRQILTEEQRAKMAVLQFEFPRQKKQALFKKSDSNQWAQAGGDVVKLSTDRLQRFIDALKASDVQEFQRGKDKAMLLQGPLDVKVRVLDKEQNLLRELPFVVAKRSVAYTTGELADEVKVVAGEFIRQLPIRLEDFDVDNNKPVVVNADKMVQPPHPEAPHEH